MITTKDLVEIAAELERRGFIVATWTGKADDDAPIETTISVDWTDGDKFANERQHNKPGSEDFYAK